MSSGRVPSSQHAIPRDRRRAPSQTFLLLTRMQEVVHQQGDQGDREKHHQRHDQDMEKCNHGRFLLCSIDLPEAGPAGPTMSVHEAARVSQPVSAPLPIQHAPSERAARGLRLDRAAGPSATRVRGRGLVPIQKWMRFSDLVGSFFKKTLNSQYENRWQTAYPTSGYS